MRKTFFAAFVAALSIFSAIPSYARVLEGLSIDFLSGIDTVGWYHDGTGWKYRNTSGQDTYGWIWVNGRLYHIDEKTRYCDLDTTVIETRNNHEGRFTVDKTGALTENGVVVDLGHKDGEFTFLTFDLNLNSDQGPILDKNYFQELEKKALKYSLRPTGEKIYWGEVSDYNYHGWVIAGPGFANTSCVTFFDETACRDTTWGKMKEHPEHTYSLKLMAVFDDPGSMRLNFFGGIISPTSSLVPAGYLPTP
ncbi:hypothetical protein BXO88_14115 [Oribacterium sp. C9]|uniref:hypothetical protein n=1 Tax=Oribacterium sp. C9 TaxID=1943579 RepID=UPI00098EF9A5|nr:hypothetical protein [Oribacterium sp. C9]OON85117.1 hypothetical protein BXO88_14115 [Oribacterium sp. C9]